MSRAPRIAPAEPPYADDIQQRFDKIMPPGLPPLLLFRVLARDSRLFERFAGGGLLDKGHLSLRQREIVIHRVTAKCGSEYEWGVHAAFFARKVGFSDTELAALVHGDARNSCWAPDERLLIEIADGLHENCDIDDALWQAACEYFSDLALLEILLLAGFYRTVSYITNAVRLPSESFAERFPGAQAGLP